MCLNIINTFIWNGGFIYLFVIKQSVFIMKNKKGLLRNQLFGNSIY